MILKCVGDCFRRDNTRIAKLRMKKEVKGLWMRGLNKHILPVMNINKKRLFLIKRREREKESDGKNLKKFIYFINFPQDFREKNVDLVRPEILATLKKSSLSFVRELMGRLPLSHVLSLSILSPFTLKSSWSIYCYPFYKINYQYCAYKKTSKCTHYIGIDILLKYVHLYNKHKQNLMKNWNSKEQKICMSQLIKK